MSDSFDNCKETFFPISPYTDNSDVNRQYVRCA